MGSDYAMNPPQPVTERREFLYVGSRAESPAEEFVLELLRGHREFKVTPTSTGCVIHIYTGEWR